jgi:flagellar protein FlgJ
MGIELLSPIQSASFTAERPAAPEDPAKVRDAAEQFEALLLGQILRSAKGKGWLGEESSAASDCASDFAEQHLAMALAKRGGLGLADLISKGLQARAAIQTEE